MKKSSVFTQHYSQQDLLNEEKHLLHSHRVVQALSYVPDKSYVLDLGCSFGMVSAHLADTKHCKVDGWDLNKTRYQIAKKYYARTAVSYFCGDITRQKFQKKYDVVLLLEVLEHVDDPLALLSWIYRALKPGGFLILSTPNANDYLQNLRNLSLYAGQSRQRRAERISSLNQKDGTQYDHLYAWTWDTLWILLNRVGFKYQASDITTFTPPSWGKLIVPGYNSRLLAFFLRPFMTNLLFKVSRVK
jgi:2-polyprenyl-3-methyl-5-hydroxy-6-metoxy-1,4-benzoquinol methylase